MPRKERTGVVVSDAMRKTVVVMVERTVSHRHYKKVIRRRKRYQAHDETNLCRLGDTVLIEECRPLSRRKHWRVVRILDRHEVAEVQPEEIQASALEAGAAGAPAPPTSVDGQEAGGTEAAAASLDEEVAEPVPAAAEDHEEREDGAAAEDGEETEDEADEEAQA